MVRSRVSIGILSGMAAAIILTSCVSGVRESGETLYTAVNMWYEHPLKLLSTNYHRGIMIPAGTKIEMIGIGFSRFTFEMDGMPNEFVITYAARHDAPGNTFDDFLDSWFLGRDPLGPGTPYESFSSMEKEQIEKGELAVGMSKNAVLMAYGYPPGHMTPALDSRIWKYWNSRASTVFVFFKDGRVSKMEKPRK